VGKESAGGTGEGLGVDVKVGAGDGEAAGVSVGDADGVQVSLVAASGVGVAATWLELGSGLAVSTSGGVVSAGVVLAVLVKVAVGVDKLASGVGVETEADVEGGPSISCPAWTARGVLMDG
jgi:hypothetical protein